MSCLLTQVFELVSIAEIRCNTCTYNTDYDTTAYHWLPHTPPPLHLLPHQIYNNNLQDNWREQPTPLAPLLGYTPLSLISKIILNYYKAF